MTTEAQSAPYARTFSLEFPGQSTGGVTVIRFEGEEHLSRPYRFVIDFAAKATRPLSAFNVHIDLIAWVTMNSLPFSRRYNKPLQHNMIVRKNNLAIGIIQIGIC